MSSVALWYRDDGVEEAKEEKDTADELRDNQTLLHILTYNFVIQKCLL